MVLAQKPADLPLMESRQMKVRDAMLSWLSPALEYVNDEMVTAGGPDLMGKLIVPRPQDIKLLSIRSWDLVSTWPTLTINGYAVRSVRPNQHSGSGQWVGTLELDMFMQDSNPDIMPLLMGRYGAALWEVLRTADATLTLGGQLDMDSVEIEVSEPGGVGQNMRAVELRCRVGWYT